MGMAMTIGGPMGQGSPGPGGPGSPGRDMLPPRQAWSDGNPRLGRLPPLEPGQSPPAGYGGNHAALVEQLPPARPPPAAYLDPINVRASMGVPPGMLRGVSAGAVAEGVSARIEERLAAIEARSAVAEQRAASAEQRAAALERNATEVGLGVGGKSPFVGAVAW